MNVTATWPTRATALPLALAAVLVGLGPTKAMAATPTAIAVVSGNGQTGACGATLGGPLTVSVTDSLGKPVVGTPVTFAVTAGGGQLSVRCVLSGSTGRAATSLTLGLEGTNTVSAKAGAVSVTFIATAKVNPAQHADYYVCETASGASDSNDGLSPTFVSGRRGPWLRLQKAAGLVQAGDVVHVGNGTYSEDVVIDNSGTAAAPIRFYPIKGQSPVVRSFRVYQAHYVEIRGFKVVGPKVLPAHWVDMPTTVMDVPSIVIDPKVAFTSGRQALVNKKYATYVNTINNVFNGANFALFTGGIRVTGSSYVTIANNTVSLHTIGIDLDGGSSHLTVVSNDCFRCREGIWSYAASGPSVTDSRIANNHCHQCFGVGITLANLAARVVVEGNLCDYNGIHQFSATSGANNCTFRGNVARYGGYYTETMPAPGSSAYNFYSVGYGNVCDGNEASYQYDRTQNDGNGFIVDTSANPVKFVNNLAYRNSGTGITFTKTNGNIAVNNTLVSNGYQSTSASNGAGLRFSQTVTGNTIVNNVFSGNRACGIQSNGALRSQVTDYNVYAPGVPAVHDSYTAGQAVYQTAADVKRLANQEGHGLTGDPKFLNSGAADFRLNSGSVAIGKADPACAPATDNPGLPRSPPPCVGAFEEH